MTPTPSPERVRALTKAEREIVLVIADDEASWHLHTDSRRAASTRLLKAARAWGVEPQKAGAGYECDLPLKAVRFVGPAKPASPAQKASWQRVTARARMATLPRRHPSRPGDEEGQAP